MESEAEGWVFLEKEDEGQEQEAGDQNHEAGGQKQEAWDKGQDGWGSNKGRRTVAGERRQEAGVLYYYKGEVAIPILGHPWPSLAITEVGVKENIMNAYEK